MKKIKAIYEIYGKIKSINQLLKQLENMKNLKDKATNVCGIVLFACGIVATLVTAGVALPAVVITGATAGAAVAGSVIAYLTGKDATGAVKSPEKVDASTN